MSRTLENNLSSRSFASRCCSRDSQTSILCCRPSITLQVFLINRFLPLFLTNQIRMWKKNKMYVKLTQEQELPDEPLLCEKCLNIERVHNRFLSKSNARAHFDEICEAIFSYLQRCFNNLRSFCPGFSQASRRTSLYLSYQIQQIYFISRAGKGKHFSISNC